MGTPDLGNMEDDAGHSDSGTLRESRRTSSSLGPQQVLNSSLNPDDGQQTGSFRLSHPSRSDSTYSYPMLQEAVDAAAFSYNISGHDGLVRGEWQQQFRLDAGDGVYHNPTASSSSSWSAQHPPSDALITTTSTASDGFEQLEPTNLLLQNNPTAIPSHDLLPQHSNLNPTSYHLQNAFTSLPNSQTPTHFNTLSSSITPFPRLSATPGSTFQPESISWESNRLSNFSTIGSTPQSTLLSAVGNADMLSRGNPSQCQTPLQNPLFGGLPATSVNNTAFAHYASSSYFHQPVSSPHQGNSFHVPHSSKEYAGGSTLQLLGEPVTGSNLNRERSSPKHKQDNFHQQTSPEFSPFSPLAESTLSTRLSISKRSHSPLNLSNQIYTHSVALDQGSEFQGINAVLGFAPQHQQAPPSHVPSHTSLQERSSTFNAVLASQTESSITLEHSSRLSQEIELRPARLNSPASHPGLPPLAPSPSKRSLAQTSKSPRKRSTKSPSPLKQDQTESPKRFCQHDRPSTASASPVSTSSSSDQAVEVPKKIRRVKLPTVKSGMIVGLPRGRPRIRETSTSGAGEFGFVSVVFDGVRADGTAPWHREVLMGEGGESDGEGEEGDDDEQESEADVSDRERIGRK